MGHFNKPAVQAQHRRESPMRLLYLNSTNLVIVSTAQQLPLAALRLPSGFSEGCHHTVFSLLRRRNITPD
jgi:hypothetical protein